ncbi:MAG: hypothetical protein HZA52_04765 [Planctomycetes bacterium]|nr:hypothetical protein [Planctomycetota bacterium]
MLSPAAPTAPRAPSAWKPRALAVLFGTVAALFSFVLAMQNRSFGSRASVDLDDKNAELAALLAERDRALSEASELGSLLSWRLALPERIAKTLFPMRHATQTYDEYCFYRYKPGIEYANEWPEHPKGRWYVRTNSLGLREDSDTPKEKLDLRVLVTGDSHTDGVCDNAESFANLVEAALATQHPGKTIDVGNAGKGGYSFYSYLGVLERFVALDLAPDVFVVTVYGGNDFEEALAPWHFFAGIPRGTGLPAYWDSVEAARKVNEPCLSQGMLATKYFQQNPDEVQRAREATLGMSGQIIGECRAHGIVPLFVYLPSWYELDPDRTMEDFAGVVGALGLAREDIARVTELGERYVAGLRALGAEVVDLRPAFRAERGALYWQTDHHINLAGHARVAEALLAPLEALGFGRR